MWSIKWLIREYLEGIIAAIVIALCLRFFMFSVFYVAENDMNPTILEGDFLLGFKSVYNIPIPFADSPILLRPPKKGDVVALSPKGAEHKVVRRVFATSGDKVEKKGVKWFLNGEETDFTTPEEKASWGPLEVSPNQLFLVSDNLSSKNDSRSWGQVPLKNVNSRITRIWLSIKTDESGWSIRWNRIFAEIK